MSRKKKVAGATKRAGKKVASRGGRRVETVDETRKNKPLTARQAEMLGYIREGLSDQQIHDRCGITRQGANKHRGNLRKMGYEVDPVVAPPETSRAPQPRKSGLIALHAVRASISIYYAQKKFNPVAFQYIDNGIRVECYGTRRLDVVMSGKSFKGTTEDEAKENFYRWLLRTISRIENDLHVKIIKPRAVIHIQKLEYAVENPPEGEVILTRLGDVKVFSTQDGKLRVRWDKSNEVHREFHHMITGYSDAATFERYLNAELDNPLGPTLPELAMFHEELAGMFKTFLEVATDRWPQTKDWFNGFIRHDDDEEHSSKPDYFG